MNYAVTINLPYGFKWIDHLEREIEAITFTKEVQKASYGSGTYGGKTKSVWYNLRTFGTLDRVLGKIPESPIQELSDWTVTMDSVFSDGDVSTMDLLYYLKALNEGDEEDSKEFNLVGCQAVLWAYQGSERNTLYICSVVAVSSANGTTSITFSERIGTPVIAKKSLPLVFGNSGSDTFWPVKMTKNTFGIDEVILSETQYGSSGKLFMYLEEKEDSNPYVQVSFVNGVVSDDKTKITFEKKSAVSSYTIYQPIEPAYFIPQTVAKDLMQQNDPVNCIIGNGLDKEYIQVWTIQEAPKESLNLTYNTAPSGSPNYTVQVGRSCDINKQKNYDFIGSTSLLLGDKPQMLSMWLEEYPSSISESGGGYSEGVRSTTTNPRISGNPGFFLDYKNDYFGVSKYPTVWLDKNSLETYNSQRPQNNPANFITNSTFHLKFPEYKLLPDSATVQEFTVQLNYIYDGFRFIVNFCEGDNFEGWYTRLNIGKENFKTRTSQEIQSMTSAISITIPTNCQFSRTQHCRFIIDIGREERNEDNKPDFFTLRRLKTRRLLHFPFSDNVKLYTSAPDTINSGSASGEKSPVIPAIKSLLYAANHGDNYEVRQDGTLENTIVNSVMTDETAEFRAKLKTLAIASSSVVRMNRIGSEFLVSSLEKKHQKTPIEIPWECLVLENNIYSFSMQTPMKDQIYSGLEISYGKNIATGKYEHRILIDKESMEYDGEYSNPVSDLEWGTLRARLGKNFSNGINNLKSIENEWIVSREGAERAAYTYLSWCCAPLYTAQIKCVKHPVLEGVDIGSFVKIAPPKYPDKLKETVWLVTAMSENLDSYVTTISLLETWNAKIVPTGKYLLTEDRDYINMEDDSHFLLEESRWQKERV
jgi:hypothetical protein